ncbi:MAG: flagellar basal body protein, partial [Sedimentisphaerales bacterium]|nr:flagellar basal body protein [Sedimentisphaerales bacterium]
MAIQRVFGPIDIAVSGMKAQDANLSTIYSNVANALTVYGSGMPYRRVEALLAPDGEGPFTGVKVK